MARTPGSYGKPGMGPKKTTAKKKTTAAKRPKKKTFGQTFKERRAAGVATFTYNGKKYSTKTKEEVGKKNTRKQAKSARKEGRATARKTTGIKNKMAARRAGRVKARKIKDLIEL